MYSGWQESFFKWPESLEEIVARATQIATSSNVYFSSHLFSEQNSQKKYVLPSRTIQADLDNAEIATIPVVPTVLVSTSPGRHQGYWITDKIQSNTKLEELSRRIAYGINDCDKTGWPMGKKVRLPGTINYKYDEPHLVEVSGIAVRSLTSDTFNIFPEANIDVSKALSDISWVDEAPEIIEIPAIEILAALKGHVNPRVYMQFNKAARDRSAALWMLMCELFKAGATRDQVYHVACNSANNKFADRKYNGLIDLRKDILRAERVVATKELDYKALVMDLRHNKGELVSARRKKMADLIINHMRETGEFVHTKGGSLWYLQKTTGRPISISPHSDWLTTYLSTYYGLNSTEQEYRYVIHEIIAFVRAMPTSNELQTLSYYDVNTKTLMIHTGGRDVIHVTSNSVTTRPNGFGNIVFQWGVLGENFSISDAEVLTEPWWENLFHDALHNLVGMTRDEALVILRAWFLFLLFRNITTTRPILALFGQPGGTKTTTAKIFYRLIYGRYKNISGLSNEDNFDMEVTSSPFVAYDNCDTWQSWLPDRLAQSAGNTVIGKRRLWTDNDMVYLERQALVAVTAHNPRFAREDITDRLLLLLFHRLQHFTSESVILDRLSNMRNELWASIIRDVQAVLRTAQPTPEEIPQFRIEDYAHLGAWFSKAVSPDMLKTFKNALSVIQGRQRSQNIEEDAALVNALRKYVEKRDPARADEFQTVSAIWLNLSLIAPDTDTFKKQYRQAQVLGRKLWVMQASLKSIFDIEYKDETGNMRTWRIRSRKSDA